MHTHSQNTTYVGQRSHADRTSYDAHIKLKITDLTIWASTGAAAAGIHQLLMEVSYLLMGLSFSKECLVELIL